MSQEVLIWTGFLIALTAIMRQPSGPVINGMCIIIIWRAAGLTCAPTADTEAAP